MEWLVGIVVGVLTGAIVTWSLGFLNQLVPSPGQSFLAIENLLRAKTRPSEDRFCFVLCWLENDSNGSNTDSVAQAFSSVEGITLVRSARVVKASGAADDWRPAMQRNARKVLEHWQADLAVVGLVKESGKALSLWFVPRAGDGTLARGDQPYELDQATLGPDFHEDLSTQLTALALAAVAPLAKSETRGRVLKAGLREATEKLDTLLKGRTIDKPERRVALQWALGNALVGLGERESGPERLKQAIDAYRAALEKLTRKRAPLQWAFLQKDLGTALQTLGARENGTARLEQAVEAYRATLEVLTRERVPLDWAATQNNLGNALFTLGERKSGIACLERAVEAYRAALKEYTRDRVPLDWAMTQSNLGAALSTLGERETGTARLEQAVEAFRTALEERPRAHVPLDWAATQNNLGNALLNLAKRETGTARLEQAVEVFRAALEERTREHVPLDWAATQNNLGSALQALGKRGEPARPASGTGRRGLPRRTRRTHPRTHVPLDWAATQNNACRSRLRPSGLGQAGERHGPSGTGRRGLPRRTRRTHPRTRTTRLGHDAE